MSEVVDMIRRAASALPATASADIDAELEAALKQLSATLTGTEDADAVACLAALRAAMRELQAARGDLAQAAAGCREYLSAVGA